MRILLTGLIACWLCMSVAMGQQAPGLGIDQSGQTASKAAAKKGVARSRGGPHIYEGRVVQVNVVSGFLSIRGGGGGVSFDVSNPTFSGYKALADIRQGDMVGVSYTETGIRIVKLSGTGAAAAKEKPLPKPESPEKKVSTEAKTPQALKQPTNSKRLQRRQVKTAGSDFEDVDVNKDGKISPVEFSIAVPDITMERFRQYDKNKSGFLDRSEFSEGITQDKAKGSN